MVAVFLNYRRDDSRHITERIHDRLCQAFGADRVFKDLSSISPGNDFRLALQGALGNCQVLLAVIGKQWLSLADLGGRRRIDDEADFVRLEIETALNRSIRVIPILVDGALPPRPADLPVCLEGLAYAQMVSVRPDPDFHNDMDRLIAQLQQEASPQRETVPLVEQVAAIYELMQYDVERRKVIAGRTVDLFLTGKHGDLDVQRVIGCFPNPVSSDDLHRFTDLLRAVKREYRQARGTIVSARPVSAEVAVLANQDDLNLTTHTELSGKLLDGRTYANSLRLRCGETEQYPTPLYVVPMIGETVQGGERPAFTGFVRPADADAPLRDDTPGVIERWLTDPKVNQLTLLGDVGTGKTFLMRILASELARRYLEKPAAQPLPLLIDLRDTDREVSLEGLVLTHLQSQGLRQITFPVFEHAVRNGQIILLFDGFDEMAARTSPQVTRRNFQQLARCARGKAKILITCRTHYFSSRTEEEEVVLGSTLESGSPVARELLRDLIDGQNCRIAYLRPFELPQIREYVERARPKDAAACLKKIEDVYNLPELCQRPMLLQMIVKSIDRLGSREINPARLYEVFTEVWINRDTWRAILPRDRKLQFVTALARVFWQEGVPGIHYTGLINHVKSEFAAEIEDPRRLVEIDSEVRTATFLTRDDHGHYGFAHKSYAEYFLARDLSVRLHRGEIDCLRTKPLTPEVLTFLKDLIDVEPVESLLEVRLTGNYVRLVSENCLLTLYGIRRQSLLNEARELGQQTDDLVIALPDRAVLPQAKLPSVNLEGAVLRGAILDGADLSSSSLVRCDLTGASLTGANLEQGDLSEATIRETDCSRANLRSSVWLGVSPAEGFRAEGADWANATVPRELAGQVGLAVSPVERHPDGSLLGPEWWGEIERVCLHEALRVRRRGYREIDAEDLVSDIWLRLLHRSPAINLNEPHVVRSYVRSLCMDAIRRNRRNRRREILETELDWSLDEVPDHRELNPELSLLTSEHQVQLAHLLNELPELERDVIVLRYLRGLSYQEVANRLSISVATIARRTRQAVTRLREAATHWQSSLD
jgi:RNA polymerase sigma factor (sigma-70 family)